MLKKAGKSGFLMISFSLLVVLMLNACGASGETATPTASGGGAPVKGGTWIDDLYEEPDSLIPNASYEVFAAMVLLVAS
jgi:peptide/nickel transport system substrate-binding protein